GAFRFPKSHPVRASAARSVPFWRGELRIRWLLLMFNWPAPKRRSSGSTKLPLSVRCQGEASPANGAVVAPERRAALIVSTRPAAAASVGSGLAAAVWTRRAAAADTTGVPLLVSPSGP